MSKYSMEFKMKFVKIYLESSIDFEKLAEKNTRASLNSNSGI